MGSRKRKCRIGQFVSLAVVSCGYVLLLAGSAAMSR